MKHLPRFVSAKARSRSDLLAGISPRCSAVSRVLRSLCACVVAVTVFSASALHATCLQPPADVTANVDTDVLDVQCVVLVILWKLSGDTGASPECLGTAVKDVDLNCDTKLTVTDALLTIKAALSLIWDSSIDADGDMCADNCTLFVQGHLFGDGFVQGADDGVLTVDDSVGTPRFVNSSTDGIFIVTPGLPGTGGQ